MHAAQGPESCSHTSLWGLWAYQGSYVDWVEAGGARVVPIVYTNTAEEIRDLVSSLNGVRDRVACLACGKLE